MSTGNVWASIGESVTLSGGSVITDSGASVTMTDEIVNLLRKRVLLGYDPSGVNPDPSPLPTGADTVGDATRYVVPAGAFSVTGDGITDDAAAFSALITGSAAGGTITLQGPYTYYINANVTFAADVSVRFLRGAVLKIASGRTVTILGPMSAGLSQCFDVSLGGTVLLPGKTVWPEWWGAKNDDGTTDCKAAITAAGKSLANSSGVLELCGTGSYYGISDPIDFSGYQYSHLVVRGQGWNTIVKHTQNTSIGTPGVAQGLFTFYGDPSHYVPHVRVENIWIRGNSATLDYRQAVTWAFCNEVVFDKVKISDVGLEGFISLNTEASTFVAFYGCYATTLGKAAFVSAYNANAHQVIMDGCYAVDCALGVEHTGQNVTISGCIIDTCTQRGLQIFSTSHPNEGGAITGNVIRNTPQGIVVQDASNSIGRLIVSGNMLIDCNQGINVSAVGNGACQVSDNYMIGGNQSTEAIYVGPGRHIISGNTFARVTGSTTGSITSGSSTLQLPTGTSVSRGCKLTITGVSGTKTVTDTEFSGSALFCTLDSAADATVSGAAVSYYTEKWAYCVRVGTDDYHVIEGNVVSGECWTTTAFALSGFLTVLKENVFQLNGATSTGAGIFGVIAGSVITGLEMDITTPFTYSYTQRSEITCSGEPVRMTWKVGDRAIESAPTAGGDIGLVCTSAGTEGTLSTTGGITSGTTSLVVASATGIYKGAKISIAGVTGTKTVTAVSGTTVTIDVAADATVAGAAVAYVAPTWKAYGAIAP